MRFEVLSLFQTGRVIYCSDLDIFTRSNRVALDVVSNSVERHSTHDNPAWLALSITVLSNEAIEPFKEVVQSEGKMIDHIDVLLFQDSIVIATGKMLKDSLFRLDVQSSNATDIDFAFHRFLIDKIVPVEHWESV